MQPKISPTLKVSRLIWLRPWLIYRLKQLLPPYHSRACGSRALNSLPPKPMVRCSVLMCLLSRLSNSMFMLALKKTKVDSVYMLLMPSSQSKQMGVSYQASSSWIVIKEAFIMNEWNFHTRLQLQLTQKSPQTWLKPDLPMQRSKQAELHSATRFGVMDTPQSLLVEISINTLLGLDCLALA